MSDDTRYARTHTTDGSMYGSVTIRNAAGDVLRVIPASALSRDRKSVAVPVAEDDYATPRPARTAPHFRNYPKNQPPVARARTAALYSTVPPRPRKTPSRPVRHQVSEL